MENREYANVKPLPAEMWGEICKYLPKKDRENIQLVNSFFYKVVCSIEKKKIISITPENLSY